MSSTCLVVTGMETVVSPECRLRLAALHARLSLSASVLLLSAGLQLIPGQATFSLLCLYLHCRLLATEACCC